MDATWKEHERTWMEHERKLTQHIQTWEDTYYGKWHMKGKQWNYYWHNFWKEILSHNWTWKTHIKGHECKIKGNEMNRWHLFTFDQGCFHTHRNIDNLHFWCILSPPPRKTTRVKNKTWIWGDLDIPICPMSFCSSHMVIWYVTNPVMERQIERGRGRERKL